MQGETPSLEERAYALMQAGRQQDAVGLIEDGAASQDPDALFVLGTWRVAGQLLPRDLEAAKELFGRAAAAGHAEAAHVHVAFVTHGAGGTPDWKQGITLLEQLASRDQTALRQLQIVQGMALNGDGDPLSLPQPQRLSDSPDVQVFPGLFTAEECAFLIESAVPRFQPALVTDRSTGLQGRLPDRTADTAGFSLMTENPAIHALNRRIAAASGTTAQHGEPLQVLRYEPGQEYRPHYDLLTSGQQSAGPDLPGLSQCGFRWRRNRVPPDRAPIQGRNRRRDSVSKRICKRRPGSRCVSRRPAGHSRNEGDCLALDSGQANQSVQPAPVTEDDGTSPPSLVYSLGQSSLRPANAARLIEPRPKR